MILKDKVVVVVGVGPGLGRECARIALRDGARVVLGARNEEKLRKTARSSIPPASGSPACAADVSDPARCDALFAAAAKRFGGVDARRAGGRPRHRDGQRSRAPSPDDWRRALDVNVVGNVNVVRAAMPAPRGARRRLASC